MRSKTISPSTLALLLVFTFSSTYAAVCPIGSFLAEWSGVCTRCWTGTYCTGNDQYTTCPRNTYNPVEGSTSISACISCPVNTIANAIGIGSELGCECVPGFGRNCWLGANRIECAYQSSCQRCEPGTYKPYQSNYPCWKCPAGTSSSVVAATDISVCVKCSAGFYAPEGSPSCLVCPPDTVSLTEGATKCVSCPQNEVKQTSSSCVCAAGYTRDTTTKMCVPCAAGRFKLSSGDGACTVCSPGTFQDLQGQTQCKQCGPGTFESGLGSASCTPTPVGTYQDELGKTESKRCLAGKYQDKIGQTSCIDCSLGSYQPEMGRGSCIPAGSGAYVDLRGQLAPKLCPAGTYLPTSSATSLSSCLKCPVNTFSTQIGARSESACLPCATNAITDNQSGASSCMCPSNFFGQPGIECIACATDKYRVGATSLSTTEQDCVINPSCDAGQYGNPKIQCFPCPLNTYLERVTSGDPTTVSSCRACPVNTVTLQTGSGSISDCVCKKGFYRSGTSCLSCPVNQFKALNSNTDPCQNCAAGSSTNGLSGQASCDFCLPGYFFSAETEKCLKCGDQTYQPLTALKPKECFDPPANAVVNSSAIWVCKSGYKLSSDQKQCLPCSINEFKAAPGNGTCNLCGVGSATSTTASISCDQCAGGYYRYSNSCTKCKTGTFTSTSNNDVACQNCTNGYTNLADGSNSCDFCNINYGWDASTSSCVPCAEGFKKTAVGNVPCAKMDESNSSANGNGGVDKGVIIGAVVAGVVVIGAGIGFAVLSSRRKAEKRHKKEMDQGQRTINMLAFNNASMMAGSGMNLMASRQSLNPANISALNMTMPMNYTMPMNNMTMPPVPAMGGFGLQTSRAQPQYGATTMMHTFRSQQNTQRQPPVASQVPTVPGVPSYAQTFGQHTQQ